MRFTTTHRKMKARIMETLRTSGPISLASHEERLAFARFLTASLIRPPRRKSSARDIIALRAGVSS